MGLPNRRTFGGVLYYASVFLKGAPMRRFVTFVVGVVFGVCLAVVGTRLQASQGQDYNAMMRRQLQDQPATRLIEIPAPRGQSRLEGVGQTERVIMAPPAMVFLKDVKSDGCWLAYMGNQNEPVALAVAPAEACQQ